jgi:hypothetical protein
MKTDPGAEEAHPGAMEAQVWSLHGMFPTEWWMLTLVQMEMVNL